ncbi:prepilin peptidase [Novosphingobium bradum]|uniref:Prepilin peptidase n=1 Tax=Novosphingobium bradum TaxID=1737444 RepID=A0ABV7IV12_9SPHN
MNLLHALGTAALATAAVTAAWFDLHRRIVPNLLCAATFVAGLGFVAAVSGTAAAGLALLHGAMALAAGMGLFAARLVGGGDAKFYAAVAAWFPIARGFTLLEAVALAGLVLTMALWWPLRSRRRRAQAAGTLEQSVSFTMVPYAVAIGAGGVIARVVAG